MKAKLLADAEITNPELTSFDDIAQLRADYFAGKLSPNEYQNKLKVVAVAGTVIDHPMAWALCPHLAEPVDQECIDRVSRKRMKQAPELIEKYEALEVGQATGTAHDASDEAVRAFKAARQAKRDKMDHVQGTVTPE